MKIRRWRYFWKWFLVIALLVYTSFCAYLYWQPQVYEGSSLIEPIEFYPGEDVTLPAPPEGISVEPIAGTRLLRVTAKSTDNTIVFGGVTDYIDGWRLQRRIRYGKKLEAEQAATVQGSAEWRRYEIARRTSFGSSMTYHQRPKWPGTSNKEKVERGLAWGMGAAGILGLLVASFLTLRRGEREGDGLGLSYARLARCFAKIGLVASACYLLVAAFFFAQEADPFVSSATVLLPQSSAPEEYRTQFEILNSSEVLVATIKELELALVSHYKESTEQNTEKIIREKIAITPMPDKGNATIHITAYDEEIAAKLPASLARNYLAKHQENLLRTIHRRQEDLEALLEHTNDDQLIADINDQLALLDVDSARGAVIGVSDISPGERRAKDWLGWFTDVAMITVLQALLLSAAITIIWLLWFSTEAKALAEKRPPTDVPEFADTDIMPSGVADPY